MCNRILCIIPYDYKERNTRHYQIILCEETTTSKILLVVISRLIWVKSSSVMVGIFFVQEEMVFCADPENNEWLGAVLYYHPDQLVPGSFTGPSLLPSGSARTRVGKNILKKIKIYLVE